MKISFGMKQHRVAYFVCHDIVAGPFLNDPICHYCKWAIMSCETDDLLFAEREKSNREAFAAQRTWATRKYLPRGYWSEDFVGMPISDGAAGIKRFCWRGNPDTAPYSLREYISASLP